MQEDYKYEGDELSLFRHAANWKKYFSSILKKYIHGTVLEVGAGIGSTTLLLNDGTAPLWQMLEPDMLMVEQLQNQVREKVLPANCRVTHGTIDSDDEKFDSIIYIDVLEHIENDHLQLEKAAKRLLPGGHLIILSPAFPFLFSPFDRAIGHHRRYSRKMVRQLTPTATSLVHARYYDSVGFFASLLNKLILKKKYPTEKEVLFWDRWMIPVSKVTDHLVLHSFGKSVIAIWEKNQ